MLIKNRNKYRIITPDRLCRLCQRQEIVSWSDSYCARCDEDKSDFEEEESPREDYWSRRRRGVT